MNKLVAGVVLGVGAAAWTIVYTWVGNPHVQGLMVFIGLLSAVRAMSASRDDRAEETTHA
jgi:hypothetical protein